MPNNKQEKSQVDLDSPQAAQPKAPKAQKTEQVSELTPKRKYAPQARVKPTIGRNQVGGPKERITPKFNSVSTVIN